VEKNMMANLRVSTNDQDHKNQYRQASLDERISAV
jgi:hypothetical protein